MKSNSPDLMTFYFPNWHVDRSNEEKYGAGWTEWNVVRCAHPRFEGHYQPRIPKWGYEDESLPEVMEKKIDFAADSGITGFIWDWYWTNEGPRRERALDCGFLQARNNHRLKFAIMYCNHPEGIQTPSSYHDVVTGKWKMTDGIITEETFIAATDYCIKNYFSKENYYRRDGKLFYGFFSFNLLLESFGGMEGTKRILDEFRNRVRAAGLGELELSCEYSNFLRRGETLPERIEALHAAGFDSVFHHNFGFNDTMPFPYCRYDEMSRHCMEEYTKNTDEFKSHDTGYYIGATVGWDPSPRTVQSDMYLPVGYPFSRIIHDSRPEKFKRQLEWVRSFCEKKGLPMMTLYAFNEWTEGSYIEPDEKYGTAYADTVREVFGGGK